MPNPFRVMKAKRAMARALDTPDPARSWCACCKQVTITETREVCGTCFPKGGKTEVCHVCACCKKCGKQKDPARTGYEIDGDALAADHLDPKTGQPWFI